MIALTKIYVISTSLFFTGILVMRAYLICHHSSLKSHHWYAFGKNPDLAVSSVAWMPQKWRILAVFQLNGMTEQPISSTSTLIFYCEMPHLPAVHVIVSIILVIAMNWKISVVTFQTVLHRNSWQALNVALLNEWNQDFFWNQLRHSSSSHIGCPSLQMRSF